MPSSTDPNPSTSASIPSDLHWPRGFDFSSTQSTSRMSEPNERRSFQFAPTGSQITLDTSGVNNGPPLPGANSNSGYSSPSRRTSFSNWCSFSNASENDSKPSEKNSEANFDSSSLQSISSDGESNIRRRSQTLCIILPQSRNWEPVIATPVDLDLLEKVTTDSKSLLRTATDGTVLAGNLEGFVSRIISEITDSSRNDRFRATFLTIYQLFATSERLFNTLKRRFETDPVTMDSRYP
jgi:hypothetical protein